MASGKKTVIVALIGNTFVGICKFIAWGFSGSGAMLSEAIHSVADVSNQALLLLGIQRSEAEASRRFRYGFAAERYFWALISAVGIFFLGCGVTVYHGIHVIMDGHEAHPGIADYSILSIAFLVEGWTLWVAVKGINHDRKDTPFFEFLSKSADPTPIAVLLEDFVACLGALVALAGILLSEYFHSAWPDGIASITIGVMLGFVAVFLVYKNHALIVGTSVDHEIENAVVDYLKGRSTVERIFDVKSRVLSAENYRLKMEIEFEGAVLAERVIETLDLKEIHERVKDDPEALKAFLMEFGDKVVDELGDEVDRIEEEIREQVPEAQHIDIEAD